MSVLDAKMGTPLTQTELNRIQLLLGLQERRDIYGDRLNRRGIIDPKDKGLSTSFEVYWDDNSYLLSRPGVAINSTGRLIIQREVKILYDSTKTNIYNQLGLYNSERPFDIYISHRTTSLEMGTVNISSNGAITGFNTRFLSTLRSSGAGIPIFIQFARADADDMHSIAQFSTVNDISDGTSQNTGTYQVESVLSDTAMQLLIPSGSLVEEQNVRYRVVPASSFRPDASASDPLYSLDDILYTVVQNIEETPNFNIGNTHFHIARVNVNNVVEDRRAGSIASVGTSSLLGASHSLSLFMPPPAPSAIALASDPNNEIYDVTFNWAFNVGSPSRINKQNRQIIFRPDTPITYGNINVTISDLTTILLNDVYSAHRRDLFFLYKQGDASNAITITDISLSLNNETVIEIDNIAEITTGDTFFLVPKVDNILIDIEGQDRKVRFPISSLSGVVPLYITTDAYRIQYQYESKNVTSNILNADDATNQNIINALIANVDGIELGDLITSPNREVGDSSYSITTRSDANGNILSGSFDIELAGLLQRSPSLFGDANSPAPHLSSLSPQFFHYITPAPALSSAPLLFNVMSPTGLTGNPALYLAYDILISFGAEAADISALFEFYSGTTYRFNSVFNTSGSFDITIPNDIAHIAIFATPKISYNSETTSFPDNPNIGIIHPRLESISFNGSAISKAYDWVNQDLRFPRSDA